MMGRTDYELAVNALNGNEEATMLLWNKYKKVSMSILRKVAHLSNEDKEQEAFMVFHHKLFDLFNPEKIGVSPEKWSFSFMITGGMKNLRNRLINESKRENNLVNAYYEESSEEVAQDSINYAMYSEHQFTTYNPEKLVIENLVPTTKRVMNFYNQLSDFQKQLLRERRNGLKLKEIAEKFNCSLSKVKSHLKMAKELASPELEVTYK